MSTEGVMDELVAEFGPDFIKLRTENMVLKGNEEKYRNQLQKANSDIIDLRQQLKNKDSSGHDVYVWLQKRMDDQYEELEEMENKIFQLRKQLEDEQQSSKETKTALEEEFAEKEHKLNAEISQLKNDLTAVKEFRANKEQLEKDHEELGKRLMEAKKTHDENLQKLERKYLQEKDQMKQLMLVKIKETKKKLQLRNHGQLHTTTKRTIMENEQMTTELQYQSKETEKILVRLDKIQRESKEVKRKNEILILENEEFAKKNRFYQNLIKKLHTKLQNKEAVLMESKSRAINLMHTAHASLKAESEKEIESLQGKVNELEENLRKALRELKAKRRGAQGAEDMYNRLIMHQNDAMVFLLNTLGDVKTQIAHNQNQMGGRQNSVSSTDVKLGEMEGPQRLTIMNFFFRHLKELLDARNSLGEMKSASNSISLPPIAAENSLYGVAEATRGKTTKNTNNLLPTGWDEAMSTSALDELARELGATRTQKKKMKNSSTQTISIAKPLFLSQQETRDTNFASPHYGGSLTLNDADAYGFNQSKSFSGGPSYSFHPSSISSTDGWGKRVVSKALNPRGPRTFLRRGYGNGPPKYQTRRKK
eukprot:g2406.t1